MALAASIGFGLMPVVGHAQTSATVFLPPAIDQDYNRDRNVSVTERPHPEYDPIGLRLGSFVLHPSVTVASAYTDNVYLDDKNKKADVYANILPFLSVDSDWANHRFGLAAAGDIRRYANQTLKNQNAWYVYSQGRLDVKRDLAIQFDAQIDKTYESPYSEDVVANLTVPSTYLRKLAAVRATYKPGRTRLIASVDVSTFDFNTIRFASGATRDQSFRDRRVYRTSGVYEYALSPSLSVYGQATYDKTDYVDDFIGAQPNRDSTGLSVIGGANFDLAGIARGSFGIGFSRRRYDAIAFYTPAQGFSAQAKVELFPTELTTVTITLQRQLQDVSLSTSGAFWNNRGTISVDHELLRNMIVSASADFVRREYVELQAYSDVYQFQTNARYQASRRLGFTAGVSYGLNQPNGAFLGNPFSELRGLLGVRIKG